MSGGDALSDGALPDGALSDGALPDGALPGEALWGEALERLRASAVSKRAQWVRARRTSLSFAGER